MVKNGILHLLGRRSQCIAAEGSKRAHAGAWIAVLDSNFGVPCSAVQQLVCMQSGSFLAEQTTEAAFASCCLHCLLLQMQEKLLWCVL